MPVVFPVTGDEFKKKGILPPESGRTNNFIAVVDFFKCKS
jgi:hypothetical protein